MTSNDDDVEFEAGPASGQLDEISPSHPAVLGEPARDFLQRLWRATVRVVDEPTCGTGFFVASDLIVTNAHVVDGCSRPVVELTAGSLYSYKVRATTVAIDYPQDLAVLRLEIPTGPRTPPFPATAVLTLGDAPLPGDDVWFCGYPMGVPGRRIGRGCVSGYHETEIHGHKDLGVVIDATVNRGNSGGAVVDEDGRVRGVIYAMPLPLNVATQGLNEGETGLVRRVSEGFRAITGQGFVLDPGNVAALLTTYRFLMKYKSMHGGAVAEAAQARAFSRADFIGLQKAVVAIARKDRPTDCSPIGLFGFRRPNQLMLGWHTEGTPLEGVPKAWIDLCQSICPRSATFLLRGFDVVVYRSEPGQKIFVPAVRLALR
jgi:hypothetical protein